MRVGGFYILQGFGDERDGKVVKVLELLGATAIVDGLDYRANVSIKRLKPKRK
jgi:hypothetical protein